jgi:SOS-response transcriptional repressor LexA
MNEKQIPQQKVTRPTKKQQELLGFIEIFIAEHGYSPSYREIMSGLNYNSVATVSVHVNNLIKRGQLYKRDRSARSLELVSSSEPTKITSNQVSPREEKWLVEKVEHAFGQVESLGSQQLESSVDNLSILVGALRVLGLEGAAQSFVPRLNALKSHQSQ